MNLLKDLELVEVVYESDNKKVVMTFLYEEAGEIREVIFNKQSWSATTSKFIDDEEKALKVDEWCEEYFGTTFDKLTDCIGVRKDIYDYDTYCSLWESNIVSKFKEEDLGLIDEGIIKEVKVDDVGIKIHFEFEGQMYESKMTYSKWMDSLKKFLINPQQKKKQIEKFEEKFGVSLDKKDELIGKTVMFEVKKAGGKFIWVELKAFKKRK